MSCSPWPKSVQKPRGGTNWKTAWFMQRPEGCHWVQEAVHILLARSQKSSTSSAESGWVYCILELWTVTWLGLGQICNVITFTDRQTDRQIKIHMTSTRNPTFECRIKHCFCRCIFWLLLTWLCHTVWLWPWAWLECCKSLVQERSTRSNGGVFS